MNASRAPAQRSFRSVLGAAVIFFLFLLLVGGLKSFRDLAFARQQVHDLEREIEKTDERIEALKNQVELLRDDPHTLERHAREDLGLVRPGDVVIVLPEE